MKYVVMRRVEYRFPATKRLVWAIVLGQREGLTLLFVKRPDNNHSHALAIATENPAEGFFEDVSVSRFPLEQEDLAEIGSRLLALGESLSEDDFKKFFKPDSSWWQD